MSSPKIIAPADAFRLLLLAGYPDDPSLAKEIVDYSWFHFARNRSIDRSPADVATAGMAIEELCRNVRSYAIRLRGVFRGNPPALIDRAEQRIGDFDVFDQVLDCGRGSRIYIDVFCVEADVRRLIESAGRQTLRGRASNSEVQKKVRTFIKDLPPGRVANEKLLCKWAKANIPGARKTQVIDAKNAIAGNPGRGRPRSQTKIPVK
jgi:hypothetical protein